MRWALRLITGAEDGGRRAEERRGAVPAVPESRAHVILLWTLAGWTGLSALAMLFAQGDFSQMLAGGLKDSAGQRLLGANLLVLAALYGLAAVRRTDRVLGVWLPLSTQWLTALVIFYDTVAGYRDFSSAWPALCVALLFALLLSGFELAGESAYEPRHELSALHRASTPAPPLDDAATQRLSRGGDAVPEAEQPRERPAERQSNDDRVLGA